MKLSPKSEALAFRICQYATPREWNVDTNELSDHLGESPMRVGAVLGAKGWNTRVRHIKANGIDSGHSPGGFGRENRSSFAWNARLLADALASGRIENGESV